MSVPLVFGTNPLLPQDPVKQKMKILFERFKMVGWLLLGVALGGPPVAGWNPLFVPASGYQARSLSNKLGRGLKETYFLLAIKLPTSSSRFTWESSQRSSLRCFTFLRENELVNQGFSPVK